MSKKAALQPNVEFVDPAMVSSVELMSPYRPSGPQTPKRLRLAEPLSFLTSGIKVEPEVESQSQCNPERIMELAIKSEYVEIKEEVSDISDHNYAVAKVRLSDHTYAKSREEEAIDMFMRMHPGVVKVDDIEEHQQEVAESQCSEAEVVSGLNRMINVIDLDDEEDEPRNEQQSQVMRQSQPQEQSQQKQPEVIDLIKEESDEPPQICKFEVINVPDDPESLQMKLVASVKDEVKEEKAQVKEEKAQVKEENAEVKEDQEVIEETQPSSSTVVTEQTRSESMKKSAELDVTVIPSSSNSHPERIHSGIQLQELGDKRTWQVDLKTLLEETYLREKGFPVSKELPLKPPSPVSMYVETNSDCSTDSESNSDSDSPKSTSSNDSFAKLPERASDKSYTCPFCYYRTIQRTVMLNHLRMHSGEKPFACIFCSYRATYKGNLDQHMRTHTGRKPYKCSMCSYTDRYKYSLIKHMELHADVLPHKCEQCGYRMRHAEELVAHARTHSSLLHCFTCSYRCLTAEAMEKHVIKHLQEWGKVEGEVVPICIQPKENRGNPKIMTLDKVMRLKRIREVKCHECDFVAPTNVDLQMHIVNTHTGKSYRCASCRYVANTKSALLTHIETHTEEKSYRCMKCSYSAASSADVESHMNVHATEMPFRCSECFFQTNSSLELIDHIDSHRRGSLFHCSHCSFSCDFHSELREHARMHAFHHKVRCGKCASLQPCKHSWSYHKPVPHGNKVCSRDGRLPVHSKQEHDSVLKCRSCDYASTDRTDMRRHLRVHAGKQLLRCKTFDDRSTSTGRMAWHFLTHPVSKTCSRQPLIRKLFKCSHCDYSARTKRVLRQHCMRIHKKT